jgi:hypothetical protein
LQKFTEQAGARELFSKRHYREREIGVYPMIFPDENGEPENLKKVLLSLSIWLIGGRKNLIQQQGFVNK